MPLLSIYGVKKMPNRVTTYHHPPGPMYLNCSHCAFATYVPGYFCINCKLYPSMNYNLQHSICKRFKKKPPCSFCMYLKKNYVECAQRYEIGQLRKEFYETRPNGFVMHCATHFLGDLELIL